MRRADALIQRVALVIVVVSIFGGFAPTRAARAENLGPGGGTRIIVGDQVVGPYRLYITSSPEPAYVGKLTFVVRISEPTGDQKVLDADILVELTHSEDGEKLTGHATHEDAGNPIDYAAHIPVERTGVYDGVIRINGPAGDAEVTFLQQVVAQRGLSGIIIAGFPFLVVLALLGGLWYARAGSRPVAKPDGPSGMRSA
jgi:hypothetical protein